MAAPAGENPNPNQIEVTGAELDQILLELEPRGIRRQTPSRKYSGLLMLGCFGFLVFTVAVVLAVGGMALRRASNPA